MLVLLGDREHLRIEVFAPYYNHLKYDIDPEEGEQYGVTEEVKDVSVVFFKLSLSNLEVFCGSRTYGVTLLHTFLLCFTL